MWLNLKTIFRDQIIKKYFFRTKTKKDIFNNFYYKYNILNLFM